ncbi:protein transport protein Sec61 subunit beta [Lolium perenne]|uniref:protein transport protein Sec61 subunit beta n=1 Tax=Lolium perenne TaxID=4522 RepID=UPI0021E9F449|nr:protein transport protein Sec61 subunit beta-like [Lolium perenne]
MARTSSQSQSSVGGGAGASRPATVGPRGTAAATAGMRRRPGRTSSSSGVGGGFSGGGSNMLRFYTDEAPGLRLSPTMVLVMSVCFIGFVTALHVFGKLYRSRTAASSASA